MGALAELSGKRICVLEPEHLVGRAPHCALRLGKSYVSAQHAVIRWHAGRWELLDRGSRNGTRLDGELIEPRRAHVLELGSVIAFGHPREQWKFCDESAPAVMVVDLESGSILLGHDGVIGVPSNDDPECTVYRDTDGAWKLEHPDRAPVVLENGSSFEVRERSFRFCCPDLVGTTATADDLRIPSAAILRFTVSSDEEFVELEAEYPSQVLSLGSRTHNYLLLLLARARLTDEAAGLPSVSCGWVDKEALADALRTTPTQIDGEVFRIRRHLGQAGLPEAASIIERRPRTKQLRIGTSRLVISKA